MENKEVPVLKVKFSTKNELYTANMPFIKGRGIFIPTNDAFQLGDEVVLNLELLDDKEKYVVPTKVVWITPRGAQGNATPGIGLQFLGKEAQDLSRKIDAMLAGKENSDERTDTM